MKIDESGKNETQQATGYLLKSRNRMLTKKEDTTSSIPSKKERI